MRIMSNIILVVILLVIQILKKIRKLCDLYGIDFDISCKQIRTIRDNRNKLAHGEDSFSERGRIPYEYVENLKSETISYLENFISAVEDYITQYKIQKAKFLKQMQIWNNLKFSTTEFPSYIEI